MLHKINFPIRFRSIRFRSFFLLFASLLTTISMIISGCAKQFPDVNGAITLTIDSISPSSGSAGTSVLVYGKGFSGAASGNRIYFNGVAAVPDTIASYNVLRVFAPANGSTGTISIAVKNDSAAGPMFKYLAAPVAPVISNVVYNGRFVIYGSNFDGQASVVSIGGQTMTGFIYVDSVFKQTLTKTSYTPAAGLDNPAPVIVTATGIPSNSWPYLFFPSVTGFTYSRTSDGNPVSVTGALFGTRSVPSTLRVFYYSSTQQKVYLSPDPMIVSWTTGLIQVNVPGYFSGPQTHVPPPTYIEVSVSIKSAFLQFTN